MKRSAPRKLVLLALCAVVLLSSCRSWRPYPDVSLEDMHAGLQLYLQEHHGSRSAPLFTRSGDMELEISGEINGWLVLFFVIFFGGLVLPLDQSLEVVLRDDGKGGSELSVEATEDWRLFFFIPVGGHNVAREERVRGAILANARRRRVEQRQAEQTVRALIEAVRSADLTAFRALLHEPGRDPRRARAWLQDDAFWAAERAHEPLRVSVSWPPEIRKRTRRILFGLSSETTREEYVKVSVALGAEHRRYELIKAGGGYSVVLPIGDDGRLHRR